MGGSARLRGYGHSNGDLLPRSRGVPDGLQPQVVWGAGAEGQQNDRHEHRRHSHYVAVAGGDGGTPGGTGTDAVVYAVPFSGSDSGVDGHVIDGGIAGSTDPTKSVVCGKALCWYGVRFFFVHGCRSPRCNNCKRVPHCCFCMVSCAAMLAARGATIASVCQCEVWEGGTRVDTKCRNCCTVVLFDSCCSTTRTTSAPVVRQARAYVAPLIIDILVLATVTLDWKGKRFPSVRHPTSLDWKRLFALVERWMGEGGHSFVLVNRGLVSVHASCLRLVVAWVPTQPLHTLTHTGTH